MKLATTMRQLKAKAEKLGVSLEEDDSGLWAYAPFGKHFIGSVTATITQGYVRGQFKAEARDDIMADFEDGIEECDEETCTAAGHFGSEHPMFAKEVA